MQVELTALALSAVLVVTYILAPAFRRLTLSREWAAGNRDGTPPDTGIRGQRADRAVKNILETYPVFVAVTLGVVVAGGAGTLSAIGAVLYVAARVFYWPAYVYGLGPVRSVLYGLAMLGIVLELIALFGAAMSA